VRLLHQAATLAVVPVYLPGGGAGSYVICT